MKGDLAAMKGELLKELGKPEASEGAAEKAKKYEEKKTELQHEATVRGNAAEHHLETHERLAMTVTFGQIAIAIAAISALTRKRQFWFVSLVFGCVGVIFLIMSFLPGAHH